MSIKVCRNDAEPVVFTFENDGAEWLCVVCGWTGGLFDAREVDATLEMAARRDQLLAEYEHERGLKPPDQDVARPTCSGCSTQAEGRLDALGKPAHWYVRRRDGVSEFACSRDCIGDGMVMPW